jgi:hypothetical protein
LRYDEDIGEDDGRVDQALESFNGLECERRGNFGAAAAFEEVMFSFGLMILGQIATSYVT